jgi:putative membrane protein
MMVLYLMSADIVNTALSAFLAFCDKAVYSFCVTGPNPFHVSPVSDQVLGAVVMWVLGSFVFLVPAILITVQLLAPEKTNILAQQDASRGAG